MDHITYTLIYKAEKGKYDSNFSVLLLRILALENFLKFQKQIYPVKR